MEHFINVKDLVSSVVFSFFGIAMFGLAFFIFDKLTPGDLGCELLEKQNTAAAIVVGALVIGMSIIIGLAIH
ncbi:MAG: DUF350 domain-containing protein [Thermodesulfovibrio sp.]|nr:DUF350 domain-containing protein [Thermodesulfovibrio sp.]